MQIGNVCNPCYTAYLNGKWDPAKEQFAGSTGDPKWLDQEYRTPWQLG